MRTLEEIESDIRKVKVENTKLRDAISDNEKKIDVLNQEKLTIESKDTIEFCEKKLIGKIVKKRFVNNDISHELYAKVKSWELDEDYEEEVVIHGECIELIYDNGEFTTYCYDRNMTAYLAKCVTIESSYYFGLDNWEEITEDDYLEAKLKIREV